MPNMWYNRHMIDINKIAYAAGFFDGDGCITTSGTTGFRLSLANTDYSILLWFQNHFGGTINNAHLPSNPKHNKAWKWIVTNKKDVYDLLILFEPFLIVKKQQAQVVISFFNQHGIDSKTGRKISIQEKHAFLLAKNKIKILKTDKHYTR